MHLSKVSNFAFLLGFKTYFTLSTTSKFISAHPDNARAWVGKSQKVGILKRREREIRTLKHLKKKPSTTIHQICMQLLQAFNAFHLHQAPPPFACLFLLWMESIVKSNFSGPPTKKNQEFKRCLDGAIFQFTEQPIKIQIRYPTFKIVRPFCNLLISPSPILKTVIDYPFRCNLY